jgi:aldose sugar dehydrogenase
MRDTCYHILFPAAFAVACSLASAGAQAQQSGSERHQWGEQNVPDFAPAFDGQFRAPVAVSNYQFETAMVAEGLTHPWAVEKLPGGNGYLVTERSGDLRHVTVDGTISDPLAGVPEVLAQRQGGLLDVKLGPDFANDRMIYLTYSKPLSDGMSATAAGRGRLSEELNRIEGFEDIFVQEPPSPSPMHYGSRIVFDDAGHAFITTGEHFTMEERELAQELGNTYGKVVRFNLDGSVPQDNPFVRQSGAVDSIWSYGHRNIQGAAMREGELWIVEHGPQGGDEVNVPQPGENYGWPVVSYGEQYSGEPVGSGEPRMENMEEPVYYWDPVIAPGDAVFYDGEMFPEWQGDMLIGALVAGGLVRLEIEDGRVQSEERLVPDIGRTRDVEVLDDGSLLVATDYEQGALIRISRAGS